MALLDQMIIESKFDDPNVRSEAQSSTGFYVSYDLGEGIVSIDVVGVSDEEVSQLQVFVEQIDPVTL